MSNTEGRHRGLRKALDYKCSLRLFSKVMTSPSSPVTCVQDFTLQASCSCNLPTTMPECNDGSQLCCTTLCLQRRCLLRPHAHQLRCSCLTQLVRHCSHMRGFYVAAHHVPRVTCGPVMMMHLVHTAVDRPVQ